MTLVVSMIDLKLALMDLGTKCLRFNIFQRRKSESTQILAKELATKGSPEGTTVIVEIQTAGKGRNERLWESPKGGLWLSLILTPDICFQLVPMIGLMAGCAVADVIKLHTGIDAGVKWPNDVEIEGMKVAGILSEANIDSDILTHVILGIGVNLNFTSTSLPNEVRAIATTVMDVTGKSVNLNIFTRQLLRRLDELYSILTKEDSSKLAILVRNRLTTLGRSVSITTPNGNVCGIAVDLADDGALKVRLSDGSIRLLYSGEVLMVN